MQQTMLNYDNLKQISDKIYFCEAQTNPLSADIGIILGKDHIWVYDVGSSETGLSLLTTISHKNIVISHFHPDHMGNLTSLDYDELYVGKNTYNYTKKGNVVDSDIYIEDGCKLHIFPIPSSHAKGCLGLEIDETFAFIGDAMYANMKGGVYGYNVQHLSSLIQVLKELKSPYLLLSHKEGMLRDKKSILYALEKIYSSRKKDEPFIPYSQP